MNTAMKLVKPKEWSAAYVSGAETQESPPRQTPLEQQWPVLQQPALYGLAGDIVRAFDPVSESDPAALLMTTLVMVGNAVGRAPHMMASHDRHALNLFAVAAGKTSKGRKGTSFNSVKSLMVEADDIWAKRCISGGLSSGEGLIWSVRDPIHGLPKRAKGEREDFSQELPIVDPGVSEKRLLVVETEFASMLSVMGRDGSTLSATARQSWDGSQLRVLNKNSPATATNAHISILAHVTFDELRKKLSSEDSANGFGNRFLFFCSKRSKCLPDGGELDGQTHRLLVERLRAVLAFSRCVDRIIRDEQATQRWREVYPDLSEGEPGLVGALTGRAEAQVLRLSALYAVLDRSRVVQLPHLDAALALWEYCYASTALIFGAGTGNTLAEKLYARLETAGRPMTKRDLHSAFQGHVSASALDEALRVLEAANRAGCTHESTKGRPKEIWRVLRP